MSKRILGVALALLGAAFLMGTGWLFGSLPVSAAQVGVPWVGNAPPGAYGGVLAQRPGGALIYAFGHTVMRQTKQGWHLESFPPSLQFQALVFSSMGRGILYGLATSPRGASRQVLYATRNGGISWRPLGAHPVSPEQGWRQQMRWTSLGYGAAASLAWAPEPLTGSVAAMVSKNGIRWQALPGEPKDLAVTGIAAQSGHWWLAGQTKQGGLLGYLDGTHWHSVLKTSVPLSDVAFDGSYGIALGGKPWMKFLPMGTATQVTYVTHDKGRHWTLVDRTVHAPASFSQIFLVNQREAFAAAGQVTMGANGPGYQRLYRTVDGGHHWTPVLTGNFGSVTVSSANTVSVAAATGVLWQTQNAGKSWRVITPNLVQDNWVDASPAHSNETFLQVNTGFSALLLESTNSGRSWTTLRGLGQATPVGWFGASDGVLETGDGQLLAVKGEATTAIPLPHGVQVLLDAQFSSISEGWILCSDAPGQNSLYHTTDGGRHWVPIPLPLSDAFQVSASGRDVALLGVNSDVAVSTDGGLHWRTQHLNQFSAIFSAAAFDRGGRLWAFGTRGGNNQPMVWQWNGTRLKAKTAGQSVQSASFGSAGTGWAVTFGQSLYRSANGGRSWQYVPVRFAYPITLHP